MQNRFAFAAVTFATLLLTGCSMSSTSASSGIVTLAGVHGKIYGGQQPISGALVQLYQAGTSVGYGQGASALITGQGVATDAHGGFTVTGTYQCTPGKYVYITSTGGNPGGGNNPSATMIAGLGLCDNLSASTFIILNEVTTVGTVWALAPFMNGVNIGAPSTNQAGLAQAFADVNTLVNVFAGSANLSTTGVSLPSTQINTLADILAACINSTGSGDAAGCDTLFAKTIIGSSTPSDVVSAAINMARNPGNNVSNLLALVSPMAPFQPTLATANDFTMSATYTGSGISAPTGLAVDASGNVWAANSGAVTELSHAGALLSGASGFAAGTVNAPSAIAIDTSGNAWVANSGNSKLLALTPSGSTLGVFTGNGLATPSSLAFDGQGNLWVGNSGASQVSEFSAAGASVGTFTTASPAVSVALNPR